MAHSTRNDLADALRQLLSDRSLDKITVQNIADAANVSRKTFYYHFQDVYDLLEWMLEQHRTNLEPQVSDRNAWRTAVANLLDFCLENQAMIQNLFRSISRDSLDRYTYSILLKSLTDYTRNQATPVQPFRKAIQGAFAVYGTRPAGPAADMDRRRYARAA